MLLQRTHPQPTVVPTPSGRQTGFWMTGGFCHADTNFFLNQFLRRDALHAGISTD